MSETGCKQLAEGLGLADGDPISAGGASNLVAHAP